MRYVSLFAGAGGLDLGLKLACPEAEPLLITDADPDCCTTVEVNNLGRAVAADIHDLLRDNTLADLTGSADLVVGGPPCQAFSKAGKQDPGDPRAQLVHRFMDAIGCIRPKAFLMENVEALASARHVDTFNDLMWRGHRMGYSMHLKIMNARSYGVAQNRHRAFLFGMPPGCYPRVPWPQFETETVRTAIDGVDHDGDVFPKAKVTLAKKPVLRVSPYAGMMLNGGGRVIDLDDVAPTITASIGGNRTHVIDLDQLEYYSRPWIESYHGMLWGGGKPMEFVPSAKANRMRRLSMRECAVLQGFHQYYRFCGSGDASRWRQIGNAVPPPLAKAAVKALLRGCYDS